MPHGQTIMEKKEQENKPMWRYKADLLIRSEWIFPRGFSVKAPANICYKLNLRPNADIDMHLNYWAYNKNHKWPLQQSEE